MIKAMKKEMNTTMELSGYMRSVGTQLMLVGIALAFFVFPVLADWYLGKHVKQPCPIERVLAQTCEYDSITAASVHWLSESAPARFFSSIFDVLYHASGKIVSVFAHNSRAVSVSASVITLLGLWWLLKLVLKKKADAR